jgi:hypothetical protein
VKEEDWIGWMEPDVTEIFFLVLRHPEELQTTAHKKFRWRDGDIGEAPPADHGLAAA